MSNQQISVKDANAASKLLLAQDNGDGTVSFYHVEDAAQRSALLAAFAPLASAANQIAGNNVLTTIANNTVGNATAAAQATGNNTLATIASNTTGVATAAGQTSGNTSLATIAANTNGAATAAAQTTGNASLAALVANTNNVASAANQVTGNTALASIASNTATGNSSLATIATSVAGGATAVAQTTGNNSLTSIVTNTGTANTSLASLATKTDTGNTSLASILAKLSGVLSTTALDPDGRALRPAAASVAGTFTAVGSSAALAVRNDFNISFWGTFTGTVRIERSFDNGTTYLPLTALGTSITFTAPATEIFSEPEFGVKYRVTCSAYTSGTINYRISQ